MATTVGNGSGVIQSLGIGSGLDIQSLVSQLVAAEGAPQVAQLTRKSAAVATQLSAMGSLKGALSAFQSVVTPLKDTSKFQVLTATSADNAVFTASAGQSAVSGSYGIQVTQLATAQQLVSKEYTSGAATVFDTGTLTLTRGTSTTTLDISSSNNTLAGIRDAINASSSTSGVQATIITSGTSARLALTSTATGAANTITVASSGGGLAQLEYTGAVTANWTVNQQAQDASLNIAGVTISSASNTVTGAIDGVTLNLVSAKPGVTNNLSIATDQNTVIANVRKFVNGYNAMRKSLDSLSYYDAASRQAGPLLGDPLMGGISDQMRRLSLNQVSGLSGVYTSLAAIGVTSDTSGQMSIDQTKLTAALTADSSAVARLFGSTNGIATRLDSVLTAQLSRSGGIAARDSSLAVDQKNIAARQVTHEERMAIIQQRYLTQFTALDTLMSQLKQTSTFLTQQLTPTSSKTS